MSEITDAIAYLTQNITYIVTIIATVAMAAKYIISENRKHAERIEKKILGIDRDAKRGKGGIIDDLRQEFDHKIENTTKDLENKISQSQNKLIFEYQRTTQKIDFVVSNLSRIERSLEKVTHGRYTSEKLKLDSNNNNNNDDDNKGY